MIGVVFLFGLLFRWGFLHKVLLVVGWCQVLYYSGFICVSSHYMIPIGFILWWSKVLQSVLLLQRLRLDLEFCVGLYILFCWSVLLSALSWFSACTSVSEGIFLMYLWREMYSMSTYSSAICSSNTLFLNDIFIHTCCDFQPTVICVWAGLLSSCLAGLHIILCKTFLFSVFASNILFHN